MQSEFLIKQDRYKEKRQKGGSNQEGQQRRPYVYELDQLRVVTALSVIVVHVLAFTAFLNPDPLGTLAHNGLLNAFHFTRDVFMFITGLALVYTYYGKPFALTRFWKKRSVGVLIPYLIWTIIYTFINAYQPSPGAMLTTILGNVLSGNASYQLYYILLTLQFYLLLPVFLWLLGRVERHPWTALGVSFVAQLILWTVDYFTLEAHAPSSGFFAFVAQYQDSFVLTYQFYFVLGGIVALHLPEVRAWLLTHRLWIFISLGVTLAALSLVYLYQTNVAQASIGYAVQVLQPAMIFYSVSVIAFLYWLAYRRVSKRVQGEQPRGQRFWHTLSDASFGIYLVHPIVLSAVLLFIIPSVETFLPGFASVSLTWVLAASGAALCSIVMMNIPILSRLVGRSRRLSDGFPLADWLKRALTPGALTRRLPDTGAH